MGKSKMDGGAKLYELIDEIEKTPLLQRADKALDALRVFAAIMVALDARLTILEGEKP